MKLATLERSNEERAARRASVVVTDLETFESRFVGAQDITGDPLGDLIGEQLRQGRSATVEVADRRYFLAVQVPPLRLILIGAVHISQALAPIARIAGFDVTIIDPRTAFASPERFPDVRVVALWPEEALATIPLDRFTAVAALTHDPKIDDPALAAALRSECFYVGALGSRKTHAGRVVRLAREGFSEAEIARVAAPIGVDISAISPAEIAVSIVGEMIAALRRKPARAPQSTAA
jgi:xanthine dehydrogenase accessory factor